MATVYFIQSKDGPIKIGWTTRKPEQRLADLQLESPLELTLVKTIVGGRAVEKEWHERFDHRRLWGEWFRPDDDLLAAIETADEGVAVEPSAKTEVFQIRLYPEEKAELHRRAKLQNTSIAKLIRQKLNLDASGPTWAGKPPLRPSTGKTTEAVKQDLSEAQLERRVQFHKNNGKTSPVARRLARKELGLAA